MSSASSSSSPPPLPPTLTPGSHLPPGRPILPTLSRNLVRTQGSRPAPPGALEFRVQHAPVCLVNALRRTILSDIPCVVFRCFPDAENQVIFHQNTWTSLHNELVKQRLECVPIHVHPKVATPEWLERYQVEVDETNTTEAFRDVTTEHFRVVDTTTGQPLTREQAHALSGTGTLLFPPNQVTHDHVLVSRLRPRVQDSIPGDTLKFTARMSLSTAAQNGSYAVASLCTYENTPDTDAQAQALLAAREKWTRDDPEANVAFLEKNWWLLDSKRVFLPNDYQFRIVSVGVLANEELVFQALQILSRRLDNLVQTIVRDPTQYIVRAEVFEDGLDRGVDVTLPEERHTLGEMLRHYLYHFFLSRRHHARLDYVGFRMKHPHDSSGILRVQLAGDDVHADPLAYTREQVVELLQEAAAQIQTSLRHVRDQWVTQFYAAGQDDVSAEERAAARLASVATATNMDVDKEDVGENDGSDQEDNVMLVENEPN